MFFVLRIILSVVFLNGVLLSHANAENSTKILLFGDSIVAGYGLSVEDSLSVQLEKLLKADGYNVRVVNAGVSGDTTSSGLSRLGWTVKRHQPDILLLALGGNDVLRGFAPEVTQRNLDAMLALLAESDVQIIFSKVQAPANLGLLYKKQFDSVYINLADKYDIQLFPFLLRSVFGNKDLMQGDQIHPNSDGVKVIAKDVKQFLATYLK